MREMTVAEFKARLDAIGDDELCCGTFWLADDFLSIDPALTREEIASAMEIAEDNQDASEGFNWGHLEWAISEMKVTVSVGPPPAGGCSQSPVTGRESADKVFPYAKRSGIMFRDGKQGDGA